MYRRLSIVSLELEGLGLRQETNRQALMRQLANAWDTQALQVLVDVIEPLKIYDRNQGDTIYTVFSPLTKLADVAIPDQPLPRRFNRQVDNFLAHPNPTLEDSIVLQLDRWEKNDSAFRLLLAQSPVLEEAAPLSAALSQLAAAGREAMNDIHNHHAADARWLRQQTAILQRASLQSGRCELQIVAAIGKLIDKAGQL